MANRDVNLIIRAKNEASKTLGGVTDAIKLLKDAQDRLVTSADGADQSVASLSGELDRLKTAAEAAEQLKKVEAILGTMGATVDKLKNELTSAEQKMTQLGSESAATAKKITDLEAEAAKLTQRQKAEKTAADEAAKAAQKQAAAYQELKKAKAALAQANALPPARADRSQIITAAQTTVTDKQGIFDAATAGSTKANEVLKETARQIKVVNQNIKELRTSQTALAVDTEKTKGAIQRQTDAVTKAEVEFSAVTADFASASAGLNAFGLTADTAQAKSAGLMAQIERLGAVMKGIGRYSTGGGSFTDPKSAGQMQKLNADRDAALATQQLLQAEARNLSAQIKLATGDTTELVQRFQQVTGAAGAAKAEVAQLAAQMHKMSGTGNVATPTLDRENQLLKMKSDALRGVKAAADNAAPSIRRVGAASAEAAGGMIKLNHESRQAMSVFQRIRGEVLALASAYVGLFGTINSVGTVISSFQTMEAAQNRLGVVFGQDQQKTGVELQWLAAQASRLGIEFGALSNQYSKFAVSANAANFSSAETRKIFIALAEAGRVNKLSLDDMNGVFLAATQMIQKSKVSAEELRQQMAERLPGAVNIFADALGVTTAELSKMMEQGQVLADSSTMVKFADELTKKFGPQLAKSLSGTSKLIGDFRNNLFQGSLQAANGGFIDAFNRMLGKMNAFFKSREGHDFFMSLGAAAGRVADLIGYFVDNLDTVKTVLMAIVQVKFAQWLYGVIMGIKEKIAALAIARAETAAFAAAQAAAGVQTVTFASRLTAAAGSVLTFAGSLAAGVMRAAAFTGSLFQSAAGVVAFGARLIGATAQTFIFFRSMDGGVARSLIFAQSLRTVTGALASFSFSAVGARLRTIALGAGFGIARVGAIALAGGMAVARAGVSLLSATIAALGGPLGILLTIASFFAVPMFAEWIGGVDGANRAADEHQRIMSAVLEQYGLLKGKTDDWARAVKSVSLDQANANLREMADRYEKLKNAAANQATSTLATSFSYVGGFDGQAAALTRDLRSAGEALRDNTMGIDDYIAKLKDLYEQVGDNQYMQSYIENLLKSARAARDGGRDFSLAAEIANGFGSTIDLVARGLGILPDRLEDVAEANNDHRESTEKNTTAQSDFAKSITDVRELVPQLADEMARLKKITDLTSASWTALAAAFKTGDMSNVLEVLKLWGQGISGNLSAFAAQEQNRIDGVVTGGLVGKIIGIESNGVHDAQNPNSTATGAGQFIEETWLDLFRKYFPEEARTMTEPAILELRKNSDISAKMVNFYLAENAKSLQRAGVAVNDANLYLAHFLGPGGAAAVLKAAPGTALTSVLGADQIAANPTILGGGRTTSDVIDWAKGKMGAGMTQPEIDAQVGIAQALVDAQKKVTDELEKQRVETEKSLSDMGFENTLLSMRLAGGDKEAFIEERIRALKEQNKDLTAEQERSARVMLATQYDLNKAIEAEKEGKKDIEAITGKISALEDQRASLLERRGMYEQAGDSGKVTQIDGQVTALNFKLTEAIDNAIAMYRAIGGDAADAAIAKLETTKAGIENVGYGIQQTRFSAEEMKQSVFGMLENGFVGVFDTLAQAIANGENAVKSLGTAFQQMAGQVLIELGQMILKQLLFNAISGMVNGIMDGLGFALPGLGLGGSAAAAVLHSGGIAGQSPTDGHRNVSPAWFANAARYHSGGIAGVKPGEVPAILEAGEEVLTEDDPMHSRNRGKGKDSGKANIRILNLFDVGSLLSEALKTVDGEDAILNHVRANPGAYKQAMGG